MKKKKTYNDKEIRRILADNGWKLVRISGGHLVYKKEGSEKHIMVTRKMNKVIFLRLMKENNLKEVM